MKTYGGGEVQLHTFLYGGERHEDEWLDIGKVTEMCAQ
jgi:hypothetical protein